MRPQPDQYSVQGITVEDSMSMVHVVWQEAPVLRAFRPESQRRPFPIRRGRGRNMERTTTAFATRWPKQSRASRFQSTSETAARLRPNQPARELVFLTDTGRANLSSPP